MGTILVVDDNSFCRDLVAKILRKDGHVVITAASAVAGFAALAAQAFDLILLDNEMPQTSGLAFLRQLRENPRWSDLSVIMLTGNADRQNILAAGHWHANGYILKASFTPQILLQRVDQQLRLRTEAARPSALTNSADSEPALAANPLAGAAATPNVCPHAAPAMPLATTTRDKVLQAIDTMAGNKSLGGVIMQIISIASSPYRGLGDLVSVVRQDPLIAARVFHAANSAAFASAKGRVASLEESVRNIGLGTVRTLAMSVGIYEVFPVGKADGADLLRCWQHALAVACFMDKLVPSSTEVGPGIAYLVGLCHDLDELLLRQRFPEVYAAAMALAQDRKVPVPQIYPEIFGMARGEIIEHILSVLALPEVVAKPVKQFTLTDSSGLETQPNGLLRALQMSNYYAHALQLSSSSNGQIAPIPRKAMAQLTPEALDLPLIRSEVLMSTCALARLTPKEEKQFMQPLFSQSRSRIWYLRHPSLSPVDPILAALQQLGQVTEQDHLPNSKSQLTDLEVIVMAVAQPNTPKYACADLEGIAALKAPSKYVLLEPYHDTDAARPNGVVLCPYPLSVAALREVIQGDSDGAVAPRGLMTANFQPIP